MVSTQALAVVSSPAGAWEARSSSAWRRRHHGGRAKPSLLADAFESVARRGVPDGWARARARSCGSQLPRRSLLLTVGRPVPGPMPKTAPAGELGPSALAAHTPLSYRRDDRPGARPRVHRGGHDRGGERRTRRRVEPQGRRAEAARCASAIERHSARHGCVSALPGGFASRQ